MNFHSNQPEWGMLIKGELNPEFNSYALRLILERIRNSYSTRLLSLESAVDQMCRECEQNRELYKSDLYALFDYKQSEITEKNE